MLILCSSTATGQTAPFQPLQKNIKVLSTSLDGFGIPFQVSDNEGQFIEVQLYISRDQGKSWRFHSRQPISAKEFPFTADGDGEYWFAIKTLDRNRRLLPDGEAQAELKIIVDKEKPELGFQISSDAAGRVVCRWQANDAGLDPGSLRIRYRASAGEFSAGGEIDDSWNSVPYQSKQQTKNQAWTDQIAWWPDTAAEQLEVELSIADYAGNVASASRYVEVKYASWRKRSTGTTLGAQRSTARSAEARPVYETAKSDSSNWKSKLKPFVTDQTQPQPNTKQQPESSVAENRWRLNDSPPGGNPGEVPTRVASSRLPPGVDIVAPPVPSDWDEPADSQTRIQIAPNGNSVPWESEVLGHESREQSAVGSTMSPAPSLAPSPGPIAPRATDSIPSNPATMIRSGDQVISESTTSWPDNQWNGPVAAKVNPNSELAPRTKGMVPIRRPKRDVFTSEPGFSNAGYRAPPKQPAANTPAPINAQQQMPQSANTQYLSTKRFQLNYDINAIDPSGVGRVDLWITRDLGQSWKMWGQDPDNKSPFPVKVTEEGIYGFRIVVRSQDGLAGRGPMRGEDADMWVQVDVTAPLAKITSVPYGRGDQAGQLIINYAVSDSNLVLRPNSIMWSTNPDGPWTVIEQDLRNDGRMAWKPGQNVPQRIFLRLESADRAGNVGIHNLEQAIDISGLIPRGTIFGVTPVGK